MKRLFGLRMLALAAAFITILLPNAASAQCANCNPIGGLHCSWGPWASGWKTCKDIPGGCEMSGDCSETFALDLDGRVLRAREGRLTLPSVVDAYFAPMTVASATSAASYVPFESVFALRDCKGYLEAEGFRTLEHTVSVAAVPVISI